MTLKKKKKQLGHAQSHLNNEFPYVSLEIPKLTANARGFGQILQDNLAWAKSQKSNMMCQILDKTVKEEE